MKPVMPSAAAHGRDQSPGACDAGPENCHPGRDPGSIAPERGTTANSDETVPIDLHAVQTNKRPRDETAYLLNTPANATRLLAAIGELNAGNGVERQLSQEVK